MTHTHDLPVDIDVARIPMPSDALYCHRPHSFIRVFFYRLDTKKDDRICWQELLIMLAQEFFEMLFVQRAFLPEKCPCKRVLCRI